MRRRGKEKGKRENKQTRKRSRKVKKKDAERWRQTQTVPELGQGSQSQTKLCFSKIMKPPGGSNAN